MDELTPNEFFIVSAAYSERHKQESESSINTAIIGAYYSEVFRRQDESKPLPPLSKFLVGGNNPAPEKRQSDSSMLAVANLWNAAFGGILLVDGVPVEQ